MSKSKSPPGPWFRYNVIVTKMSMLPKSRSAKFFIVIILAFLVLVLAFELFQSNNQVASGGKSSFNKSQYPVDRVSSLWAIVNKGRVLPSGYTPTGLAAPRVSLRLPAADPEMELRSDAATALETMFADAQQHNVRLMLGSGYRSYAEQVQVYGGNAQKQGAAVADISSARPGHSEHQTGLAADIEPTDRTCEFEDCFADTSEGIWLAQNSYRYGFIIRYQKGTENLTGYQYEPWHVRFVGDALATQIHKTHQTLEQFFGLPAITVYPSQPFQLQ
jgi:zinc D-Ala-D-Ala carboxypeptidase